VTRDEPSFAVLALGHSLGTVHEPLTELEDEPRNT
jgi:hypothetical protein